MAYDSTPATPNPVRALEAEVDRLSAICDRHRGKLPPHQYAELLGKLMDACDALDEAMEAA